MALIDEIQRKFTLNEVEFTKHAAVRSLTRQIAISEIREAITVGEVIEDYPEDKYSPSCLIFGRTASKRPLHVQCSDPARDILKIITVYEPDPNEWIEFRQRKSKDDE
ncbi:MAG: DUF4258 domain-containing protein [Caldilineaceae bacterium]|nr:DUF4258 domain-containing protein [Caldilineaceae bacterium]HRJ43705.1 DUF4258 domain-containing protein [Caldilineaceae bacterium]